MLTSRLATTQVIGHPRGATSILPCIMRSATILASLIVQESTGILHGTTIYGDTIIGGSVGCVLASEPRDAGSSPDPTISEFFGCAKIPQVTALSEGSLNSGPV